LISTHYQKLQLKNVPKGTLKHDHLDKQST